MEIDASGLLDFIRSNQLVGVILTAEALEELDRSELVDALGRQPPWSDCPLLLLTSRGYAPGSIRRAIDGLGNVTVLERPIAPSTLVTAVIAMMRSRTRQRVSEACLKQREAAEAKVRSLAATLEARVIARTIELTNALADREEAEARLRDSEERYRLTIDLSSQSPWIADDAMNILSFGRDAEATVPLGRDFGGRRWLDFLHPDSRSVALAAWRIAVEKRQSIDTEVQMLMPEGGYQWHRARANPRFRPDGTLARWYGTLENIDERRKADDKLQQLQAELIHVSRVSAMGTLASTLAHEINQPLTAAANYLRGSHRLLAMAEQPCVPGVDDALREADRSISRAGEIIRRLRDQVARGTVQTSLCDAADLVREACALALVDASANGIHVRCLFDHRAVMVEVDRIQIQQVLINLLRNASDALRDAAVREIEVSTEARANVCAVIVKDTGCGIDPAIAARLFEPFNSDKSDGMGIGLSISRTIIEAHHGQISAVPNPSGGTIFTITLPRSNLALPRPVADQSVS